MGMLYEYDPEERARLGGNWGDLIDPDFDWSQIHDGVYEGDDND